MTIERKMGSDRNRRRTAPAASARTQRVPAASAPSQACACGGTCPRCQERQPASTGLRVSQPGDASEREADRVADRLMRSPDGAPGAVGGSDAGVLHRSADSAHANGIAGVTASQVSLGTGQPLDAGTRSFFEPRLGADLSQVRVHADERATALSEDLSAHAVSLGSDIWFGANEYAPHSDAGRHLLAHELAHVVQSYRSPDAPATLQRKPFVISHSSGSKYEVPGLTDTETEFGASGKASSLLTPTKPAAGQPITGGFAKDLEVDTAFATGVDTTTDKNIEALIKAGGKRIDARMLPALRYVAKDKFVFDALDSFINKDKGTLEAWENDRGHYDGDKSPPTLSIGISGGVQDTRVTFVHELLHYVFDKTDSILGESKDTGGADHSAIEALETRFLIVDLIRSGKPPLDKKFDSKFGMFLKGGDDLFAKMEEAITKDDRKGLSAITARADFVKTTVSSGLMGEASGLSFKPTPDDYRYTADQFKDMAFIWAQNASIVRHAMKTAVAVADRTKTPLKSVFASSEWKTEMSVFLSSFVKGLRKDRSKVTSLEAGLP